MAKQTFKRRLEATTLWIPTRSRKQENLRSIDNPREKSAMNNLWWQCLNCLDIKREESREKLSMLRRKKQT
jgi:hypothetical protein